MLVWVDTCQKATLLQSSFVTCTCTGLNRVLRKRKVRRSVWVLSGYGISCTVIPTLLFLLIFPRWCFFCGSIFIFIFHVNFVFIMLSCLFLAALWPPVNLVRLILLNMLVFYLIVPRRYFFWGSFSFIYVSCLSLLYVVLCVTCSLVITCWERVYLLDLLCVIFSCVLSLSHMVSQVRCGTWLYRFLIFAFFFTLNVPPPWHSKQ